MTMIRSDGLYPIAECDAPDCPERAPAPGDWMKANPGKSWPGWNQLGWWCVGGRHYCPTHNPKEVADG